MPWSRALGALGSGSVGPQVPCFLGTVRPDERGSDLQIVRTQLSTMTETLSANTGVYTNTNEGSTQLANSFATGLPGLNGI